MIANEDPKLRKLDYCRISKARNRENSGVRRIFKIYNIKWDADAYYDLIEWKTQYLDADHGMNSKCISYYTEPPLSSDFSENNPHLVVTEGKVPDEVYGLPYQNVERVIKLVSEYSKGACKKADMEGIIKRVIASEASGSELLKFDTKNKFTVK